MAKEDYNNTEGRNRQAEELLAEGKNRKRNGIKRRNNFWLWFGVLILIFILIWWLWTMGIFGDTTGYFNGN